MGDFGRGYTGACLNKGYLRKISGGAILQELSAKGKAWAQDNNR